MALNPIPAMFIGQPVDLQTILTGAGSFSNTDAYVRLQEIFDFYGLGSETSWLFDQIIEGYSDDVIVQNLRLRPAYKARFPGMELRRQQGLPAITETEYIGYETTARQLFRTTRMPVGFYDQPDDFAKFIAADVSVGELSDRINSGYRRVTTAPADVRSAFTEFFGADGDAALAAVFLDPDRALDTLTRQVETAEFAGAGREFGFSVGQDLAARAAGAGVDYAGARRGFGELSEMRPLLTETISETDDLTEQTGVEATFGLGGQSSEKVRQRQKQRQAAFAGGGGAASTQRGVSGLGRAGQS